MKYSLTPTPLCKSRHLPTAACRNLPRCRRCHRALRHSERDCCARCLADAGRKEARHE